MDVFGSFQFLAAMSITLITAVVLGAGRYLASQLMVPSMLDVSRSVAFQFDLVPGWWCERDGSTFVCSPPGNPPCSRH